MNNYEINECFKNRSNVLGKGKVSKSMLPENRSNYRKSVKTQPDVTIQGEPSKIECLIDKYATTDPMHCEEFVNDVMFYVIYQRDEKQARQLVLDFVKELKETGELVNGEKKLPDKIEIVNGKKMINCLRTAVTPAERKAGEIFNSIMRKNMWKYMDLYK